MRTAASTLLLLVLLPYGNYAVAADNETATLRREQQQESNLLRDQQAQDPAPVESLERSEALTREILERAEQDAMHQRQLREQTQSARDRQWLAPELRSAPAQSQIQQMRRERQSQELQQEILKPLRK